MAAWCSKTSVAMSLSPTYAPLKFSSASVSPEPATVAIVRAVAILGIRWLKLTVT